MKLYSNCCFDWQQTVYDVLPYQEFLDFNPNQPRQYFFLGGETLPTVLNAATVILLLLVVFLLIRHPKDVTKSFVFSIITPIFLNIFVRIAKNVYLLYTPWPEVYILFILSSTEYSLFLITHLNFVGCLMVYVLTSLIEAVRETAKPSSRILYFLLPVTLPSVLICVPYFNFNEYADIIPFAIYLIFLWLYTLVTFICLVLIVPLLLLCCKKSKSNPSAGSRDRILWIYLFAALATAPTIFITGLSLLDAIYELFRYYSGDFHGYIMIATFRYLAYQLEPIFILLGVLLILPSFRNQLLICRRGVQKNKVGSRTELEVSNPGSHVTLSTASSSPRRTAVLAAPENTTSISMLNVPVENPMVHKTSITPPRGRIQQVVPGNLDKLDPLLFPGAAPSGTVQPVRAGGLDQLDPDIFPGAAPRPGTTNGPNEGKAGHLTIILSPVHYANTPTTNGNP